MPPKEIGKDADFVIWSDHPLSTKAICEQTWIDGKQYFSINRDVELKQRDRELRKNLINKTRESLDKTKEVAEERLINFKRRQEEALKALALSSKSRSEIFEKTLSLEAEFEKNDIELKSIQQRTKERANELSAVYQSLNEAVSVLRLDLKNSLLAAQYPERILFLEGLSENLRESNLIVEPEVLEEFSQLALQVIQDSELIEVFWANLIDQDGRKTRDKITRLGRFNATRGTDYLYFAPRSYDLTILTRQPASSFKKYTFLNFSLLNLKSLIFFIFITVIFLVNLSIYI